MVAISLVIPTVKSELQHGVRVPEAETACINQCLSLFSENRAAAGWQLLMLSAGIIEMQPGYDVMAGLFL